MPELSPFLSCGSGAIPADAGGCHYISERTVESTKHVTYVDAEVSEVQVVEPEPASRLGQEAPARAAGMRLRSR